MNPALVLGPPVSSRADGESVTLMRRMLQGEMSLAMPKAALGVVDVRDLAAAHCLAAFTPAAKGRYILCAATKYIHELQASRYAYISSSAETYMTFW
ncbi:3-beta hydroxysteroid dehydrogenase/isomerase domain protein [Haematococcus lacustris]|uniref:3-beta hydroxysteroid dehydrogenase/isomerase domain protein n=1 Tax=Haematococcus lacustris TaxID=44745 RepID=A0A6A0A571_HAELA|nr:3-beta hydroxysteroid dehydrogenase/isomerase domain protein [Haematococcus lacustris]